MADEIRLSWFGKMGFTFLVILLILLLGATKGIIIGSKTRIKLLENRIVKLEAIESRLTQIWEQIESLNQCKCLTNSVHRIPDVFAFTNRTAAGTCETFSLFKDISAPETFGGFNGQFFSLTFYRTRDMEKMRIDFFFPDTHS